jgi:ABC-2 type transport system ATP-binding protein
MPIGVEIVQVQKIVEDQVRLEIDQLNVEPGQIAGMVGPAGSGKELLFQLFLGRDIPSRGSVLLNQLDPADKQDELSAQVGFLFEDDSLYPRMTVNQNLEFLTRLRGLPNTRAAAVLADVGLTDRAKDSIQKLPESLARRLAFGCAILHHPQILILFEPFERCDRSTIELLSQLMRRLASENVTIVILAGETTNLLGVCDVVHLLDQGKIIDTVSPELEQDLKLPFKIPVRLEGSVALLNPTDILYAEADESRAYLITIKGERFPSQFTLSELETRLSRSGFFRAHRGYLVNLQHVTEVIPFTRNSFSLRISDDDGSLIPLSKTAAAELRQLLDY